MNDPLEQLQNSAQHVRLSDASNARIRAALLVHLEANPVRILSPYQRLIGVLSPFYARHSLVGVACLLVLMVSAGGAVAALGALPGDPLYGVKVGVLEPTRQLFARSPQAKVALNVALTETRLKEVEDLAIRDTFGPTEGSTSEARFDSSFAQTQTTIQMLSEHNPQAAAEADVKLSMALTVRQAALDTLSASTSAKSKRQVLAFAEHVRTKLGQTTRSAAPAIFEAGAAAKHPNKDDQDKGSGDNNGHTFTATMALPTSTSSTTTASTTASTTSSTTTSTAEGGSGDEDHEGIIERVRHKLGL